jgi:hypothetical protein
MATGSQCGQTRVQPVSHFSRAATEQAAAPGLAATRGTAQALPLPRSVPGHPDSTWEQTYPGRDEQVRHVRAALRPLLGDCPIADDVVLIMSELAVNAARHSASREHGGTFTARLLHVPGDYVLGEIEDWGSIWDGDLEGSARDASGLFVVLNLASACGVAADGCKRVIWFRIHYPADGRYAQGERADDR